MVSSLPTSVQAGPGPGLETSARDHFLYFYGDTIYQKQVHASHAPWRKRLINVLMEASEHPTRKTSEKDVALTGRIYRRLNECCKFPMLHKSEDDSSLRMIEKRCKARLCPLCSRARTFDIKEHLINIVDSMDSLRMVTLTPVSNDLPLVDQLKTLTTNFRKLRRCPLWKRHIKGGVWVLEVTFNNLTKQWHPHIHALVDGNYPKQSKLSDDWLDVTGDSKIVHIKMKHSKREAVAYVCKYAAKGSDLQSFPNHAIPEYATAMNGQRLMQTFGASHAIKKPKVDLAELLEVKQVHDFDEVMRYAGMGNEDALILYEFAVGVAERCGASPGLEAMENLAILSRSVLKKMHVFVNPPYEPRSRSSGRKKPPDSGPFLFPN